jgi:hypothetical protein
MRLSAKGTGAGLAAVALSFVLLPDAVATS